MKTKKNIIMSVSVFLLLISCNRTNKTNIDHKELSCLPGFIWINYVGEEDKIKRFTLIRTSENDSSYVSFYKDEWGGGFSNDKLFFEIYCNNYITNSKQFIELKRHIISHNNHKKNELINTDNRNSVRIVMIDKCDSVEYIVNGGDKGYFSNIIDSLEIKEETLIKFLGYYERIISSLDIVFGGSEYYDNNNSIDFKDSVSKNIDFSESRDTFVIIDGIRYSMPR